MADDKDETITTPWGDERPQDLSTGGAGSGASTTDTGGLDASGNELGATSPGSSQGRSERDRKDDADAGARKPMEDADADTQRP